MSVIVDTSVWVEYFRAKRAHALDDLLAEGLVVLAPVVLAEILSAPLTRGERRELTELFATLPLQATPFTHWCAVGELRARLARGGLTVSTPDAHVAQCALDSRSTLWSHDAIFGRIAQKAGFELFGADG